MEVEIGTAGDFLLIDLPDDIIYHVLSFLDVKSLCRVARVCRFFKRLAYKECVWLPLLNQQTVQIANHSNTKYVYSRKDRYKACLNWESGVFKVSTLVSFHTRLMPCLQRDDESNIWLSYKNTIRGYRLLKNGKLREFKDRKLFGLKDDVTKFTIKNDILISGCRDGSICGWNNETSDLLFKYAHIHTSETHCVDMFDSIIVSGSRDKTVKITAMYDDNNEESYVKKTIYMGDRVWSLKISPCGRSLATGTAGNQGLPALTTWDLITGNMLSTLDPDHQKGAGIINMKFEDWNTLLTCGYDTRLRMWDLRTDTCVAEWTEPFDSAVFCFETDNDVSMVTGTARYGMTRLWDKRSPNPIQQYYSGKTRSSPVYSLTFDPGRIYAALDLGLFQLDFT